MNEVEYIYIYIYIYIDLYKKQQKGNQNKLKTIITLQSWCISLFLTNVTKQNRINLYAYYWNLKQWGKQNWWNRTYIFIVLRQNGLRKNEPLFREVVIWQEQILIVRYNYIVSKHFWQICSALQISPLATLQIPHCMCVCVCVCVCKCWTVQVPFFPSFTLIFIFEVKRFYILFNLRISHK